MTIARPSGVGARLSVWRSGVAMVRAGPGVGDGHAVMVARLRVWRGLGRSIFVCALVVAVSPAVARASTTVFVSASGSDANPCSKAAPCQHISHAVSIATGGETIDVAPGQFSENITIPASAGPITISGSGASLTSVYGGLAGSVFTIDQGAAATLSNLNIGGGSAVTGGGVDIAAGSGPVTLRGDVVAFNSAAEGGGIFQGPGGSLTVRDSAIFANQATPGNASFGGGGIAVVASAANIVDSAIYQNTVSGNVGEGGGIWAIGSQHFTNDTIALNTAPGVQSAGGGISVEGGTLDGDTIANNTAATGGGVFSSAGAQSVEASDTIVAGNTGANCASGFGSGGYDLEDDAAASCGFSSTSHDLVGVVPRLGQLAANGGPTETMSLVAGSSAIGAGNCTQVDAAAGADIDQRGLPRRFARRGVCDIGAWDSGGSSPLVVETSSLPSAVQNVPYSQALQEVGGIGPYTWSVASGALPVGLSLSSAGVIAGTPTTPGKSSFTMQVTDSSAPTVRVAKRTLSLRVFPAPTPAVWVANGANSQINAFALNANGDVSPTRTLSGSLTMLDGPDGLALDSFGDLYVADSGTPAVTEYAAGANGDVAPTQTIAGSATGLVTPAGLAVDSSGQLYVANEAAQAVTVYAAGANGDVAPLRTITGPHTQLSQPWGLTIDAAGHLWVANYATSALTEYAATANADASPLATIGGGSTLLDNPMGLAQDATGDLVAANLSGGSVSVFPNAPPFGDESPSLWIGGTASQLAAPKGVDFDAANRLYVADAAGVNVFAPGANTPIAIIASGPTSGIAGADALAVAPPLRITTMKLPTAAIGRLYAERVAAVLGKAPLRWRLVRGKLPHGVRVDRSGHVTGVPRQLGTFHFTITARDSSKPAMTATRGIALTVRRSPSVTAVIPSRGPTAGGQRVTILGRNLATRSGNTTIAFGRIRAIHVVCVSHTRCIVRTPPHTAGALTVTAAVNSLTSIGSPPSRYVYRRRRE
jgi:sugar lactone lactonase YvrE